MTLDEVKNYLRIDFDDDDALLEMLLNTAKEYIRENVGIEVNEDSFRVKLLIFTLVSDWYEHREYISSRNNSEKAKYTIRSIVLALQLKEGQEND